MYGSFIAVYDACVLYPAPLRDLLMQLAATDLFRAKWTNEIHDEWIRNVLKDRPDLRREQLERTRGFMDESALDCLIEDYEKIIPSLNLPDPNDRHVLAAAIHSEASIIVTFNLKDFPENVLSEYAIEAQHPDDFIMFLAEIDLSKVLISVKLTRARLTRPSINVDGYLDTLAKQGLPQTVTLLKEYDEFL
jgi:predicted nucleic acid-binding protein